MTRIFTVDEAAKFLSISGVLKYADRSGTMSQGSRVHSGDLRPTAPLAEEARGAPDVQAVEATEPAER